MLTETNRGIFIKHVREDINYDYGDYSPNLKVLRFFEGHDWKNPQILIDFLPANRSKFQSVSNIIGNASEHGQYHIFGYCQLENCLIRCYAGKHENNRELNGRLLAEHFAQKTAKYILRNGDELLKTMNASLELFEPFGFKNASFYDFRKGSMVYVYELSFLIRTLFSWDNKPEDYEGEDDIVEKIQVLNIENEYFGKIE